MHEQSTFVLTLQTAWNHLRYENLLRGRIHSDPPKKMCKWLSNLLITLLLTVLVEPHNSCFCPEASHCSSALSCSLHCCCKNLHLAAQMLYKATCAAPMTKFEMLPSFATWVKITTGWPFCWGHEQTDYLDYNFSRSQSDENFPALVVWHLIRKAMDHKLEKPLGEAQQLRRATLAFPLWQVRSPSADVAIAANPPWTGWLGATVSVQKRGLLQLFPLESSILVPAHISGDSGFSALQIRRASDLIFFWITCHQL